MLQISRIQQQALETEPFQWAFINELFSPADAAQLAATFPCDKVKRVAGYDGEKGYEYFSRSLIHMGADRASFADGLSPSWRQLAADFLSAEYRHAMSRLTGVDLSAAPMEVNAIHYGPNCWLGPHLDLKEKLVTHVLYFNSEWDCANGGYLQILGSSNAADEHAAVLPLVGNSAVLVRSEKSWHSVARVAGKCTSSRRSLNVIFHLPGSVSTMWPPGESVELSDYKNVGLAKPSWLGGVLNSIFR